MFFKRAISARRACSSAWSLLMFSFSFNRVWIRALVSFNSKFSSILCKFDVSCSSYCNLLALSRLRSSRMLLALSNFCFSFNSKVSSTYCILSKLVLMCVSFASLSCWVLLSKVFMVDSLTFSNWLFSSASAAVNILTKILSNSATFYSWVMLGLSRTFFIFWLLAFFVFSRRRRSLSDPVILDCICSSLTSSDSCLIFSFSTFSAIGSREPD